MLLEFQRAGLRHCSGMTYWTVIPLRLKASWFWLPSVGSKPNYQDVRMCHFFRIVEVVVTGNAFCPCGIWLEIVPGVPSPSPPPLINPSHTNIFIMTDRALANAVRMLEQCFQ